MTFQFSSVTDVSIAADHQLQKVTIAHFRRSISRHHWSIIVDHPSIIIHYRSIVLSHRSVMLSIDGFIVDTPQEEKKRASNQFLIWLRPPYLVQYVVRSVPDMVASINCGIKNRFGVFFFPCARFVTVVTKQSGDQNCRTKTYSI